MTEKEDVANFKKRLEFLSNKLKEIDGKGR